jgi:hypothetical protein
MPGLVGLNDLGYNEKLEHSRFSLALNVKCETAAQAVNIFLIYKSGD